MDHGEWSLIVRTTHHSPATLVSGAGAGDGPLEGTDGRLGDRVVPALDDEAPGSAGEPARAPGDGQRFLDVEDGGPRDRRGQPRPACGQLVAVGRDEVIGPGRGPGRDVYRVWEGECELTELSRFTPAFHEHVNVREVRHTAGHVPFHAAVERDLLSRGHGAGQPQGDHDGQREAGGGTVAFHTISPG